MTQKSSAKRHFTGGTLGGLLGILAGWYLHVYAVPVGAVLGAVVGWWHAAIWRTLAQIPEQVRTLHRSFQIYRRDAHNRAFLVELCAGVVWTCVCAVSGSYLLQQLSFRDYDPFVGVVVGMFIGGVGAWVPVLVALIRAEGSNTGLMHYDSRRSTMLQRHGALALFVLCITADIRCTAGMLVFFIPAGGWTLAIFISVCIACALFWAFAGSGRLAYRWITRYDHILCMVTTLMITCLSWLWFHDYIRDDAAALSLAFVTGLSAGVCSMIASRLIKVTLYTYRNTNVLRWLRKPTPEYNGVFDYDAPGWEGRLVRLCLLWGEDHFILRFLRALCFGFPLPPKRLARLVR